MKDEEKTREQMLDEMTRLRQLVITGEERYRVLIDNTEVPITYIDPYCYILLINKIGAEYLGGKPHDFVGRPLRKVIPAILPVTIERVKRILDSGTGEQFEDWIALPRGDRFFVSYMQPVKDASGNVFAIQITSHDTTEHEAAEEELTAYREHLEDMVKSRTEELQAINRQLRMEIEERRRTEEQLRASEEKYRDLVENINDIIFSLDTDGVFTYISPIIHRLTGYSPDEVIGKHFRNFVLDEDLPRVAESFFRVKEDIIEPSEFRVTDKHGTIHYVRTSSRVIKEGNEIKGLHGIMTDITMQKQTENDLRESEQKFRRIFESAKDEIAYIDVHGTVIDVNPRVEDIFGYKVEEVRGKNFAEFGFLDEPAMKEMKREFSRGIESGEGELAEFEARRNDGQPVFVEASTKMLERDGEIEGTLVIIRDITERKDAERALKESEERFRWLIENSAEAVLIVDEEGLVRYESPAYERMVGLRAAVYTSKGLYFPVHPDDVPLAESGFKELNANPDTLLERELRIKHHDGHWMTVQVTGSNHVHDPAVKGHVIHIRDVTNQKLAESALRESEEKYRSIFENIQDLYFEVMFDGTIVELSPSVSNISHYTREELINSSVWKLYAYPEEREAFLEYIQRNGYVTDYEIQLLDLNGTIVQSSITAQLRLKENGEPDKVCGTLRDITHRKRNERELRHRLQLEETIATISSRFTGIADVDKAIMDSLRDTGDLTGADRAYVFLTRKKGEIIDNTHEWCREGVIPQIDGLKNIDCDTFPWWIEKMKAMEPIEVVDVTSMPPEAAAERELVESQDIKSFVMLPIQLSGQWSGFIGLDNISSEGEWGNDAILALRMTRDIVANGLERQMAERQIRQQNRDLTILNTIAYTSSQSLRLDGVLNNTLDNIQDILGIEHGIISLLDEGREMLNLKACRGIDEQNPAILENLDVNQGVIGKIMQTGEPVFIESIDESELLNFQEPLYNAAGNRLQSSLWVPLSVRGNTMGIMVIFTEAGHVLSPDERELLTTIGHQISTSIENALLYENLEHEGKIRRDGLRQAIMLQEEERRRIARELHDQTSQVLTGASAMIEASIAALPKGFEKAQENLRQTRLSLTNMLVDVRNIIYELRPTMLDDLGLLAAARWQAEEYLGKAGITATFKTFGRKRKLAPQIETALFRIIQEATTNIARHSKAKNATIILEFAGDSISLHIEDDGKGFNLQEGRNPRDARGGLGLLSMQERAEIMEGIFTLQSQPGHGTSISVKIPV
ncbi:MAG: PAS domain S-box protein [Dehalococcoidia bacterium]